MTVETYRMARALGFEGINLDLIYGLPLQTPERFAATAEKILALKPDRISLFSYAKVPWLKTHQKAIPDETLPSTEEKFAIYAETRKQFMRGGYTAIGMDHFALETDPMAAAYRAKKLTRNFQGYSLQLADDMIGLGVTAIGFLEEAFFQNVKTIEEYKEAVERKQLPVHRGYILNEEDKLRRWVIQTIMCRFSLDKREFSSQFGVSFDEHFTAERVEIERLREERLIDETKEILCPTPIGRLFIRLIASVFDSYLQKGIYSRAV
jgi:oxygen-independent coproporphyrinogen-3 oxidase